MWLAAAATLQPARGPGRAQGVTFVLENLNTAIDHPGTPFARAADCLALIEAVDSPHLQLMLDLYHAQIGEGNLIELIRRCGDRLGEIQVADVPGRSSPAPARSTTRPSPAPSRRLGYSGVVGPGGVRSPRDSDLALERFRTAFTV